MVGIQPRSAIGDASAPPEAKKAATQPSAPISTVILAPESSSTAEAAPRGVPAAHTGTDSQPNTAASAQSATRLKETSSPDGSALRRKRFSAAHSAIWTTR